MKNEVVTGLSIALVDDQDIIWKQGFGYSDIAQNIIATPETIYQLGSIAKVFTAIATMQLVEQNKLQLDAPFQTFLPEFSIKSRFGDTRNITPRNILTHHSGLPSNWVFGMSERHPGPFTDVVSAVKDEYTAFAPDYVFSYSNLGMTLLGAAIGKVSGEDYASYMNTHILQPLHMHHSAFTTTIPGKSYEKNKEIEVIPLRDLPSGGFNSSASDMANFLKMNFANGQFEGQQIIQAESLKEMFRVQNENIALDFDMKMGLGWMLSGLDIPQAGVVANHGGTTLNFHSVMAVLPESKLGVVVLSNSTTAQNIINKIATETLQYALETKRGIKPKILIPKETKNHPLSKKEIENYDGYFDTLIGLVKVSGTEKALHAEIMGQKLELLSRDNNQFGVRFKLFGFIPLKIGMLEELTLSLEKIQSHDVLTLKSNNQTILIGEKLKKVSIPRTFQELTGRYEIVNKHDGPMPDSVRIMYEDGYLMGAFTFPQKPGFVFRAAFIPVAEDELIMAGLGSGKGETLHLKLVNNHINILYSGFRFQKISENLK